MFTLVNVCFCIHETMGYIKLNYRLLLRTSLTLVPGKEAVICWMSAVTEPHLAFIAVPGCVGTLVTLAALHTTTSLSLCGRVSGQLDREVSQGEGGDCGATSTWCAA